MSGPVYRGVWGKKFNAGRRTATLVKNWKDGLTPETPTRDYEREIKYSTNVLKTE